MLWLLRFFFFHRTLKLRATHGAISFSGTDMQTQISNLEKFTLAVRELNAANGPVAFGGVPVWTTTNDAIANVVAAVDGITAVVTSVDIGSATITVAVDGLTANWTVDVVSSPGVQLVLTASTPEPK